MVFNQLRVIGYAGASKNKQHSMWQAECACGNLIVVTSSSLRRGTKSCGCVKRITNKDNNRKHGLSGSPEYSIWSRIKNRCQNINSPDYVDYGGRGIEVCERWMSFECFYSDMGRRPTIHHSIDRIDNNKGYSPDNCQWATAERQARNRRSSRMVEIDGETKSLAEWCGGHKNKIYGRAVYRLKVGWCGKCAIRGDECLHRSI